MSAAHHAAPVMTSGGEQYTVIICSRRGVATRSQTARPNRQDCAARARFGWVPEGLGETFAREAEAPVRGSRLFSFRSFGASCLRVCGKSHRAQEPDESW